jgi:hypothetical protein
VIKVYFILDDLIYTFCGHECISLQSRRFKNLYGDQGRDK